MALTSLTNQIAYFNSTIAEADKLTSELPSIADAADDWLSTNAAVDLLRPTLKFSTSTTICKRLHAGLVHARCRQLMADDKTIRQDAVVPRAFWWAEGEAALKCNWVTGDFETWLEDRIQLRAFGVTLYRPNITTMMPAAPPALASAERKGRPKADWWDPLWVEICRQLYVGVLQPRRQAEIEKAMMDWLASEGHNVSESTIRPRARMLWTAISKDEK